MADQDYCGGANWWDPSSANRNRFGGSGGGGSASSTTTTRGTSGGGGGGGYGWLTEAASSVVLDINATRSSLDSVPEGTQDPKMDPGSSSVLVGLGLSSQVLDWSQQPILRNPEKADNNFRSTLQEGMGLNPNFHQDFGSQLQWRDKLFSSNEDSMESTVTCQGLATPSRFQLDSSSSSSVYCSPSSILQGFTGPDQQHQQQAQINYHQNYFDQQQLTSSWAKVPQFLRGSPPKQHQQQQQQQQNQYHQLHFTNNAPYWNASSPVSNPDARPNLFSSVQTQLPMPTFEERPQQNALEVKATSTTTKKGGGEMNNKRGRNEAATSTLPPFKVRKEKMGDRITALQQLVSPFGKTDTASVLSEAIEYIKFLHEQVSVLCTPYLRSGASYQQQQQNNEKTKMDSDAPKQDLRSRGLCLVPVSSTFPVAHETTVDFWTPAFGGTFR